MEGNAEACTIAARFCAPAHTPDDDSDALVFSTAKSPACSFSLPVGGARSAVWDALWRADGLRRALGDGASGVALPLVAACPVAGGTVPVAYAFALQMMCEDGSVRRVAPLDWTLQVTHDGALWHTLDARRVPSSEGALLREGVCCVLPPASLGAYSRVRLVVRDVEGSGGSSMARRVRGTLQVVGLHVEEDRWSLFATQPSAPAPLIDWSWRLALSGPAGQRRLRAQSYDRAIDVVSADCVHLQAHAEHAVTVALQRVEGSPCVTVGVTLDGRVLPLQGVADLYGGGGTPAAHVTSSPLPPSSLCAPSHHPAPEWLRVVRTHCTLTCLAEKPMAEDAPRALARTPAPGLALLDLCVSASAAATPASSAVAPVGDLFTLAPRLLTRPLRCLEHVLLWTAGEGADDSALRCTRPCAPRYPATATGIGACNRLGAPEGRPLVLACHDCGPAVYVEDGRAGGSRGRPAAQISVVGLHEGVRVAGVGSGHGALPHCALSPLPPSSLPAPPIPLEGTGHGYRVEHWAGMDVFVYFSHDRVALPPVGWVRAAHANGVRVLATLLVEWSDGEAALEALLRPYWPLGEGDAPPSGPDWAGKLASLAAHYGFDGFLVNIEAHASALCPGGAGGDGTCPVARTRTTCNEGGAPPAAPHAVHPSATATLAFLRSLTAAVHAAVPGGLVLWYDSVDVHTGRVSWANELAPCNAPFLDACDGIFLNYFWDEAALARCAVAAAAAARSSDVFVGVDVWGRGMHGGGKWRTRVAVDAIAAASGALPPLSLAIFGPAWAYEAAGGCVDAATHAANEALLWEGRVEGGEGTGGVALPVVNPSGLLLSVPQREALGGGEGAVQGVACSGWTIDARPGQGWAVQEEAGDPPTTCFVTSHEWCWASQVVPIPSAGAEGQLRAVRVREWHRGTGPNWEDAYRLKAALLDAEGKELGGEGGAWSRDSGVLTCSEVWREADVLFTHLPTAAVSVRVSHGGRDAEGWAGHFGARMRGLSVLLQPSRKDTGEGEGEGGEGWTARLQVIDAGGLLTAPGVRLGELDGAALWRSVRPVCSTLPFETTFNCGAGAGEWVEGVRIPGAGPWLDHGRTSALPSFPGRLATSGLQHAAAGGQVDVSLTPSVAWEGGSCLVIRVDAAATDGSSVRVRLFSTALQVAPGASLTVRVVVALARNGTWEASCATAAAPTPLLLLQSGAVLRPASLAVSPLGGEAGWIEVRAVFSGIGGASCEREWVRQVDVEGAWLAGTTCALGSVAVQ